MKTNLLVHKHLIVRAESKRPPKDEEHITDWMREFVDSIGMKVLMGPYAKYLDVPGNRGLTVAAIIETSHIVMHTWDESEPAIVQLDVYTCGPFDPAIVFGWLQQYNPIKIDHKYIDREHSLEEIVVDNTPV